MQVATVSKGDPEKTRSRLVKLQALKDECNVPAPPRTPSALDRECVDKRSNPLRDTVAPRWAFCCFLEPRVCVWDRSPGYMSFIHNVPPPPPPPPPPRFPLPDALEMSFSAAHTMVNEASGGGYLQPCGRLQASGSVGFAANYSKWFPGNLTPEMVPMALGLICGMFEALSCRYSVRSPRPPTRSYRHPSCAPSPLRCGTALALARH